MLLAAYNGVWRMAYGVWRMAYGHIIVLISHYYKENKIITKDFLPRMADVLSVCRAGHFLFNKFLLRRVFLIDGRTAQ